ncbi:MAG TPA: diaminopimelate decarboxylase [Myxococcaceae bacterium]|nr:diaminopimelate decarboxylase [Myxococcaceae bacterium]
MDHFRPVRGVLHAEGVSLERLAGRVGTPTYVYSEATLRRHFRVVDQAFGGAPHLVCYSVKASGNLALLASLARWGSGFDVVSGGELARVLEAGGDPGRTVFAGVGKTEAEMAFALRAGIGMFNVESAEELEALDRVGRRLRRRAPFAVRVNPGVDAGTHRHISTGLPTSKFGVPFEEARTLYARARRMRGLRARGVDCHIGSQLTRLGPLAAALHQVAGLYRVLRGEGHPLEWLDVGGGLGIRYRDEEPPSPDRWAATVRAATRGTGATVLVEPGRVLVGNAGVLLTRVLYRKRAGGRTLVVVDAGMNDLLRPALYGAEHAIVPVRARRGRAQVVDLVGPVCESTDVLGRERRLVLPQPGDLLAIRGAGAYGMSMASTYNGRPRPAEVLVSGKRSRVVRRRERVEDLWRGEAAGR